MQSHIIMVVTSRCIQQWKQQGSYSSIIVTILRRHPIEGLVFSPGLTDNSSLQGCDTASVGEWFPTLSRNIVPSLSRVKRYIKNTLRGPWTPFTQKYSVTSKKIRNLRTCLPFCHFTECLNKQALKPRELEKYFLLLLGGGGIKGKDHGKTSILKLQLLFCWTVTVNKTYLCVYCTSWLINSI